MELRDLGCLNLNLIGSVIHFEELGFWICGLKMDFLTSMFETIHPLIMDGPIGIFFFPKLVAKERSDLLCHCIKHVFDFCSSELLFILKVFLFLFYF